MDLLPIALLQAVLYIIGSLSTSCVICLGLYISISKIIYWPYNFYISHRVLYIYCCMCIWNALIYYDSHIFATQLCIGHKIITFDIIGCYILILYSSIIYIQRLQWWILQTLGGGILALYYVDKGVLHVCRALVNTLVHKVN